MCARVFAITVTNDADPFGISSSEERRATRRANRRRGHVMRQFGAGLTQGVQIRRSANRV